MKYGDLAFRELHSVLGLMHDGDKLLARYSYDDAFHRLVIVPDYSVNNNDNYDLASLLEYTLHLALESDMNDENLWYLFGFVPESEATELGYDNVIYIDLGYVVLGNIYAIETVD